MNIFRLRGLLASLIAVSSFSSLSRAADGDLDTTYSSPNGFNAVSFGASDNVYGGFMQADGKFVVVGGARPVTNQEMSVARFNADGTLDTTFGGGTGKFSIDVNPATSTDRGTCGGVQSDGKLIIGGYTRTGTSNDDYAIIRLNTNGTLDTTFGTSGIAKVDFNGGTDRANALVVLGDNSIVITGMSADFNASLDIDYSVAKLTPNGALDTSFDTDGKVTVDVGEQQDTANGLTVQTDGKIIFCGQSFAANGDNVSVVGRLTATGALDTSFGGGDGLYTVTAGVPYALNDVKVQPNGMIVVCGTANVTNQLDALVLRLTSSGVLDTGFNSTGILAVQMGTLTDALYSLVVQADGKIVAGGFWQNPVPNVLETVLIRVNTNGTLDSGFATGGIKKQLIGSGQNRPVSIRQATDGKILVAMETGATSNENFSVARFQNTVAASAPTVTGINPTNGPTAGGTSVTITGTNLSGATGVTIGGAAATSLSSNTATSITCVTPAGTAGAKDVVVSTAAGPSTGGTGLFTYVAPPTVSISVNLASVTEDGATNLTYTVTRSSALSTATTVNIATSGTATVGTDYAGGVATVVIPANATTATWTIDPQVDGIVEPDETVILTVAAGSGYTVGSPASATATILNDDVPFATIAVSPLSVVEDGASNLTYTVTLSQASFNPVTVNYTISGTATNGTDYATLSSSVLIPANNLTATISLDPTVDTTIEGDETAILTLAAGTGYTVGVPNAATGTILNDDLPNLSINDVTLAEGNSGLTNFTFTVSLSAPAPAGGVSFNIAAVSGTANSGSDFVANSLTSQTIPAGSSSYSFTVQVNGDTDVEPNETFFVNVTSITGAVGADSQGAGTITNDDVAADIPITLSSGALAIDASSSSGAANVTLRYVTGPGGPFLEIVDSTRTLSAPVGGTQVNANTVRVPIASLSSIALTGSNAADTFTLDFNAGDICPAGGISVVGGGPTISPGDELIVDGDFNSGGVYGPSGVGAGTLTLDSGNTVTFTGLEPVDMSLASFTTFIVNVDPTSTVTGNVITTVAAVDAGVNTEITFSGGLESVKLGAVTTALVINGDTVDNDYFMLQGVGSAMVGDFSVDGLGGNADVVDIHDTTFTMAGLNKDFSAKADFVGLGRQSSALLVGNLVCSGDITLESDGDISGTPVLWGAGGVWGTSRPVYFNSTPIAAERGSVAVGGNISKTSGADATCTIKAKSAVVLPLGGTIISTSNKLHVVLNADTDATNGGGVSIAQQNIIRSNGGNITMGGGADPATTPAIGSTTGGNLNFGVNINSSEVTSAGGNISIRGTGRAVNNGVGVNIQAQQLIGSSVVNSGSGTLTIVGTGGGNFTGASGVRLAGAANASAPLDAAVFYSAKLLSSSGSISVTGNTSAGNNIGITLGNWVEFTSSGLGNINLTGIGTGTGVGVSLSPGASVSTHAGPQTATTSISSAGGMIAIIADKMALDGGAGTESITTSGAGNVTLKPLTAAVAIDLGSVVDTAGALELGQTELNTVSAPTLVIGDSASGNIAVSAVVAPQSYKTLALAKNTTFAATGGFSADVTSASLYENVDVIGTVTITSGATFSAASTGGYVWNGTDTFTLLANDGSDAITGTVAPVALPNLLGTNISGILRYNVGSNANDITIGAMSIIEGWRQSYFGSTENVGISANTADGDNDGKSNLLEFAFGTIPTNIASGPGDLVYTGTLAGNGTLTATGQQTTVFEPTTYNVDFRGLFVRRKDYIAAGLTYTPQFSVDMQTWQDSTATPTVLADDGTWEIVSVPYIRSIGGRKARFFRMSVSIAP